MENKSGLNMLSLSKCLLTLFGTGCSLDPLYHCHPGNTPGHCSVLGSLFPKPPMLFLDLFPPLWDILKKLPKTW